MDDFNAGLGAHKSKNLYSDIIYIFDVRLYYNIVICIQMILNLIVLEMITDNRECRLNSVLLYTFLAFSILSH